jgi:superfamily II DNA or RNA helicase
VDWAAVRCPRPLRTHQQRALDAIETAQAAGSRRVWVVLPPGTGKTLVGLEAARRLEQPMVVFGPNTAIQGQWLAEWATFAPAAIQSGSSRDLSAPVTALTYQSLATFDPDAEVDEEGHKYLTRIGKQRRGNLLDRLHENGRALVTALENAGPVTLILDECHHLLEVWGRLLAELLDDLPNAHVIGLTGTPPETLSSDQAALVDELFGAPLFSTSIPSVVREGHLAPFAELAWFTPPTPTESQWLDGEAERFAELQVDLLEPGHASTGFLAWLDERFVVRRVGASGRDDVALEWSRLERETPELAAAAMRFHYADLLAVPPGARLRE